jgi:predicted RNase H-like nuclease (RuvC/YqgF family)
MATSKNAAVQNLIDEVDSLELTGESLEAKLQEIARAVTAELQKNRKQTEDPSVRVSEDPMDGLVCEGCQ